MNTMTAVSFTLATIISSTGASVTSAATIPAAFVAGTYAPVERRSSPTRCAGQSRTIVRASYIRFVVTCREMLQDISTESMKLENAINAAFNAFERGETVLISDEVESLAASGIKFAQAGLEVCVEAIDKAVADATPREAKHLSALRENSIATLEGVITSMSKVTELKKKTQESLEEPTITIDLPRMEMALSSKVNWVEKKLSPEEIFELLSA